MTANRSDAGGGDRGGRIAIYRGVMGDGPDASASARMASLRNDGQGTADEKSGL